MASRTQQQRTSRSIAIPQYITLTSGEKLYIWRRRNGISQLKISQKLKLKVEQLHLIERGQAEAPKGAWNNYRTFTLGEQITIARRRRGETMSDCAKRLGVSKQAVIDWEADRYGTEEAARKLIP